MKRKNAMRNALFTSILSLLLCVSMLVSTTFAWFTDEVVSGRNTITAGNLDIELLANGDAVNEGTVLFNTDVNGNAIKLWEPGMVVYENLQIANRGTLDLKYRLSVEAYAENELEGHKLSEVVKLAVLEQPIDKATANRADILKAAKEAGPISLSAFEMIGSLEDGQSTDNQAVVIFWEPGDDDNLYNANNGKQTSDGQPLFIEFKVNLFATQLMSESDSFGSDYDKGAAWTGEMGTVPAEENGVITIKSGAELAAFAADVNRGNNYEGKTVKLGANIDLNDIPWTPIGNSSNKFNGTFIGTGYTISNLRAVGTKGVGLFGYTWTSTHIEGVTIDGAYVSGEDYVGAIVGTGYLSANCIKNCTVKNAEISATPYLKADGVTYDGGAKAGALIGSAYNGNITGNTVIDCTITAYRDLGGVAGMLYADGVATRTITASGNTVDKVTLKYYDLNGAAYDGNKVNENMGETVGRIDKTSASMTPVVENNTETNVTRDAVIMWEEEGITYNKDVDSGEVTLEKVSADYEGTTVNVPEGVTALSDYSFSNANNVETVTLPTTVRDLGRAFDSNTSVKKVVLNEGLEVISSRAFKGTTALEEVVLSSTVTEIADNAFQKSAIKEIVIPANVETIGETAFGASLIEKVTFEGNTSVQGFAFRGCPNLRTVIMLGDDNTFISSTLNGRNSMWFCNGESNNPNTSDIDFYVMNVTVAARVKTAMGAEANNTDVYVVTVPDSDAPAAEQAANISDALGSGENVVLTGNLSFSSNDTSANSGYGATGVSVKGGVLNGNGYALGINNWGTWDAAVHTDGGTIKNLTINSGMRGIFMGSATADVYIDNVVIDGTIYTFNSDGGNKNYGVYISNSTLNGWTSFSNVHKEVVFTNCDFGEGSGYAFCRPYNTAVFKNCVFEEGFEFDTKSAAAGVITFENCYYGETLITAENAATLGADGTTFFYNGLNGSVIK